MTKDMTQGNPVRMMISFSLPVLASNLFIQLYNMVDTIIVGRCLGQVALAAVGSTSCLLLLVPGFTEGLAQGFGIMIARAFGAKDEKMLRHYVALSLILTAVISVILSIPAAVFSRKLLIFMKTPPDALEMADEYLRVMFGGLFCTMAYNVTAGILRGVGDSKTPLYFMIISAVLNVGMDYAFIRFFHMGTAGAAWATVISQGIAAALSLFWMFHRFAILRIKRADCYLDVGSVKSMIVSGIPMAINYSLTSIGMITIQNAVNKLGSAAMAGYAAADKFQAIAMEFVCMLAPTMSTYSSQNLGAGKYERIKKGVRLGMLIGLVTAAVGMLINLAGGGFCMGLFVKNPTEEVLRCAKRYLFICMWFYPFLAMIMIFRNTLQGLGRGLVPMLSGIEEMGTRVIVIMLLAGRIGYTGICCAEPVTWGCTAILLMIAYFVYEHKGIENICKKPQK